MHYTNVTLSENELSLVKNESIILTKNRIIEKVYLMFGSLSDYYKYTASTYANHLPEEVIKPSPKIYKGEQYRQLPYVMLDYPRFFSKEDSFAIRSFFWWGNFFSITIHLSGKYQQAFSDKIIAYINQQEESNQWFLSVNDNVWEHHFGENNYQLYSVLAGSGMMDILKEKPFIKFSKKIPIDQWAEAVIFFESNYIKILKMLTS